MCMANIACLRRPWLIYTHAYKKKATTTLGTGFVEKNSDTNVMITNIHVYYIVSHIFHECHLY